MEFPKAVTMIATSFVLLIRPATGFADWQYTRWGMTADEIVTASGGAARAVEGEERNKHSSERFTALAVAEYTTGPFAFDVTFNARPGEDRLDTVRLMLKNPDLYSDLESAMSARYGKAEVIRNEKGQGTRVLDLRWHTKADTILLRKVVSRSSTRSKSLSTTARSSIVDLACRRHLRDGSEEGMR